jgi:hypothetical protein
MAARTSTAASSMMAQLALMQIPIEEMQLFSQNYMNFQK